LPISPRAERFLVMLHTEKAALESGAEAERCHLDDGTRVAAETARRLTCDCSTVEVTRGTDGSVLDVGRKTRKISTPMRRALEVRDRCCRFPGCNLRFVATHHVLHWGDRGPTKLDNLVLLCDYHHTLVHEGGFSMDMPLPGRPNFYDRRGKLVPDTPPPTRVSNALAALERAHRQQPQGGATGSTAPGPYTASKGRYKFDRLVPWAVEARAREAVDPG
ncbi:MAG: HNH endonuclease signature motif containing protein, partial [Gemmatimonadota bacterium]